MTKVFWIVIVTTIFGQMAKNDYVNSKTSANLGDLFNIMLGIDLVFWLFTMCVIVAS